MYRIVPDAVVNVVAASLQHLASGDITAILRMAPAGVLSVIFAPMLFHALSDEAEDTLDKIIKFDYKLRATTAAQTTSSSYNDSF